MNPFFLKEDIREYLPVQEVAGFHHFFIWAHISQCQYLGVDAARASGESSA